MFFGIGNLGFYWTKILPISYQNYLSETEILEAMRRKLDTTINEVNRIEKFLQDEIEPQIKAEIEKQLASTVKRVDEIELNLDALAEKTANQIDLITTNMSELTQQHIADITNLHMEIAKIISDISKICNDNFELMKELSKTTENLCKSYTDLKVLSMLRVVSNFWEQMIEYIEKRLKDISYNIQVINPIWGNNDSLQNALFDIVDFFNKNSLTALEYRLLDLTALEYRLLDLTALEYRLWFAKNVKPPKPKQFDLFGRKRENPISSVFGAFGNGVQANMSTFPISAELYKRYSERYNAYMMDKWGLAILSNHFPSFFGNVVYLYSDTAVTNSTKDTLRVILKLKDDLLDVESEDILTDKSVSNIVIQEDVEIVNHNSGCYNIRTMAVGLVGGGIACDIDIINECKQSDGNICSLMIDLRAITCIE